MSIKSKFKLPKALGNNDEALAAFSKLNRPKKRSYNLANSSGDINTINSSIVNKLKNNEDITQLFPDVELSIQILTSSILAPNDMLTPTMRFVKPDINIPNEVNDTIAEELNNYLNNEYDVINKLPTILREALFTKGAYVEAILPEASIDDIINSDLYLSSESIGDYLDNLNGISLLSNESVDNVNLNSFLENDIVNDNVTIEVLEEDLNISITDDYNAILAGKAYTIGVEDKVSNKLNTYDDISTEDTINLDKIFRTPNYENEPYIEVKGPNDTTRESIGKPLIMKLPVESVIPVHSVNDVSNHLGYFILLDESGAPIKSVSKYTSDELEHKNAIASTSTSDSKLNVIKKAKNALYGITKKDPVIKDINTLYSVLIENKLKKRLQSKTYNGIADIGDNSDIYEVMLYRALSGKKTRILYMPTQLVEYFAFDYRDNGTGKSMLEKVAMLFSIRSILLFTRLMANIKNSVTTTEVTATLDEDDPNPELTMETIISETLKTRQTQLPIGVTKIDDLVDWAHKVGFKYNFKSPKLPDMDISISEVNTSKIEPDSDLDDMIQEHIIMSFGLTTELVRSGYDPDFATTVVAKNILLAKRVMQLQNKLTPKLSSYIKKIIRADANLYSRLETIIDNNYAQIVKKIKKSGIKLPSNKKVTIKYLTNLYIKNIKVELPKPEVTDSTNMKDVFEEYTSNLDDYLDIILSSDALPDELFGDLSDKVDNIKVIMKTILTKKWMTSNGYMPEISQFLTRDEDGKPMFNLLEEYEDYSKALSDAILPFLKKNSKFVDKLNDKLEKIEEGEEEPVDDGDNEPEEPTDNGDNGDNEPEEPTDNFDNEPEDDINLPS